ncbi:hypothetical protein [uncultured Tenacibaculum sp.]|uniref:hypothetical protein n=1 Tax=uncultured Tenacibaculum sp. TaxID=174713 RepID=UPI00262F6D56|nr:hypothetical protein [uncultured Tenacibaculum sp.]
MKKSILNLGKTLNKTKQQEIFGGVSPTPELIGCDCIEVPDPTSLIGVRYVFVNFPCDINAAPLRCFGILAE